MEKKQTIYVGSGTGFIFQGDSYPKKINISVCLTDLPDEFITKSKKNGKQYINLTVSELKAANQWGKTHSVSVNTWKSNKEEEPVIDPNDLPF